MEIKTARVVKVICVEGVKGDGTLGSPFRKCYRFHTLDGVFMCDIEIGENINKKGE